MVDEIFKGVKFKADTQIVKRPVCKTEKCERSGFMWYPSMAGWLCGECAMEIDIKVKKFQKRIFEKVIKEMELEDA